MTCPSCGSTRVYPSRIRNVIERMRRSLTGKQPYRCHGCGWRRWQEVLVHGRHPDARPDDLRSGQRSSPIRPTDLDELDPTRR